MSYTVRELTPVEMVRAELDRFYNNECIVLKPESETKFKEIFDCALKYESDSRDKIFLNFTDQNAELIEENMLLKTQLRVLTKYISSHDL